MSTLTIAMGSARQKAYSYEVFVAECAAKGITRLSQTAEYHAWENMRQRCSNPHRREYPDYGGRGIAVDPAFSTFRAFFEEVGPRPSAEYSLDRLDVRRGYEPGNIAWRTLKEQALNTRDRVLFNFRGRLHTIRSIARELGVPYPTVRYWLRVNRYHVSQLEGLAAKRKLIL